MLRLRAALVALALLLTASAWSRTGGVGMVIGPMAAKRSAAVAAAATIMLDSVTSFGFNTTGVKTWSHTTSGLANAFMLAFVNDFGSVSKTPSYNGVNFTAVSTLGRVHCYKLVAPASGVHDVSYDASGSSGVVVTVVSFTGVNQSTPLNASTAVGTATSTNPVYCNCCSLSTGCAASTSGDIYVSNVFTNSTNATTQAGWIQLAETQIGAEARGTTAMKFSTGNLADDPDNFTLDASVSWDMVGVSVKPAP